MFLVTPKRKANVPPGSGPDPDPTRHQPLAKITKASRVQNACDRCRLKKVKCDGDRPCLRCSQDQTPCVISKKPASSDPKLLLREYVHSMESQQRRLIKALQKVHLDVRKSIKEEDMNEIVQIVRACGFDFESVSAMPAAHSENEDPENKLRKGGYESDVPATTLERALGKKNTGDGHRPPTIIRADSECPRKRTREEFGDEIEPATGKSSGDTDKDVIRNAVSIPNDRCDDGNRSQTSPLKRQKMSTCTGLMDNLGNLESYGDQNNLLNTPSDPKNTFTPPHSGQSAKASPQNTWQPMAQWPSNLSIWGQDYSSTPTTFNSSDSHNLADSSRKSDSTAEVTEFSSSVSPVGLDWESTLWWDPSLAFDMANESLGLGVEDLVSQPFEPAYELKGSNT